MSYEIDSLRDLMSRNRDNKDELLRLWRATYVWPPNWALHQLHQLAFEYNIADETACEWLDEEGQGELDPPEFEPGSPLQHLGVIATHYYRGYAIHSSIKEDGELWQYRVSVERSDEEVIFSTEERALNTVNIAYRQAVDVAKQAIAGIIE